MKKSFIILGVVASLAACNKPVEKPTVIEAQTVLATGDTSAWVTYKLDSCLYQERYWYTDSTFTLQTTCDNVDHSMYDHKIR